MGWLWATPSPPKTPAPGETSNSPQKSTTTSNSPSNNMDPEIQKFIDLFQNETTTKPDGNNNAEATPNKQTSSPSSSSSSSSSTSSSSWFSSGSSSPSPPSTQASTNNSRTAPSPPPPITTTAATSSPTPSPASLASSSATEGPAPPLNPLAESLLPTEMSCRQAFDMAFYCQSVGGQWNAVYRGGSLRSCSEHWDDFWFCMRVKSWSGPVKEAAVRDHYRRKERARYGNAMPSSEDVWKSRTEKVAPGDVFPVGFQNQKGGEQEL